MSATPTRTVLTDEQITKVINSFDRMIGIEEFARAIEAVTLAAINHDWTRNAITEVMNHAWAEVPIEIRKRVDDDKDGYPITWAIKQLVAASTPADPLIPLSAALAAVPPGSWCDPQEMADDLRSIPVLPDASIAEAFTYGARESDYGLMASLRDILDGKDTGAGVSVEPWESLRRRVLALVAAPQADAADAALNDPQFIDDMRRIIMDGRKAELAWPNCHRCGALCHPNIPCGEAAALSAPTEPATATMREVRAVGLRAEFGIAMDERSATANRPPGAPTEPAAPAGPAEGGAL